ncbi:hypothetical protein BDK51DRAFT_30637 [Blyttiomyces helicus]|uniref:PiggyBac transposable element-derived protein domain-containing protein n=1 Tax=Blyttiomyces helicus TaxID=388810 RepID=A0A4P9WJ30_9FUNG|nr:hypothetical protein BDK51DRAFT_30637 [Blyttiomyces helicus]|eukprot:RKO91933.1 hypothetical protein BDK51DRAFT_30637 [Blyttiomyces helicus]
MVAAPTTTAAADPALEAVDCSPLPPSLKMSRKVFLKKSKKNLQDVCRLLDISFSGSCGWDQGDRNLIMTACKIAPDAPYETASMNFKQKAKDTPTEGYQAGASLPDTPAPPKHWKKQSAPTVRATPATTPAPGSTGAATTIRRYPCAHAAAGAPALATADVLLTEMDPESKDVMPEDRELRGSLLRATRDEKVKLPELTSRCMSVERGTLGGTTDNLKGFDEEDESMTLSMSWTCWLTNPFFNTLSKRPTTMHGSATGVGMDGDLHLDGGCGLAGAEQLLVSDPNLQQPAICDAMKQKRFMAIKQYLHFNNNMKQPTRCTPGFNKVFKSSASTGGWKQIMPAKPIRHSIKIFVNTKFATRYIYNRQLSVSTGSGSVPLQKFPLSGGIFYIRRNLKESPKYCNLPRNIRLAKYTGFIMKGSMTRDHISKMGIVNGFIFSMISSEIRSNPWQVFLHDPKGNRKTILFVEIARMNNQYMGSVDLADMRMRFSGMHLSNPWLLIPTLLLLIVAYFHLERLCHLRCPSKLIYRTATAAYLHQLQQPEEGTRIPQGVGLGNDGG